MSDYSDDEEATFYRDDGRRRQHLEDSLFAMTDMLRQLRGAEDDVDDYTSNSGRNTQERRRPNERGRGGRARGRGMRGGVRGGRIEHRRGGSPRRPTGFTQQRNNSRGGRNLQMEGFQGFSRGGFGNRRNSQEQGFRGPIRQMGDSNTRANLYRGSSRESDQGFTGRDNEYSSSSQQLDSYEDYNDSGREQGPSRHTNPFGIRPQFLVETLVQYSDFSSSLLQLLEKWNMKPAAVRKVASDNPNVFSLNNEVISLCPQIRICQAHVSSEGCLRSELCKELHICNNYVMSYCPERNCFLGHRWRTGHNDPVLRPLFIERIPFPALRRLVQIAEGSQNFTPNPLEICKEYNGKKGCSQKYCSSLHLCQSFVTELTRCKITNCQLNHNLLNPSCSQLLEKHDIATNDAPRDVLVALLEKYPSLRNVKESNSTQKESSGSSDHKKERRKVNDNKDLKISSKNSKAKSADQVSRMKRQESDETSDSDSGTSTDTKESSSEEEKKRSKKSAKGKTSDKKEEKGEATKVTKPSTENTSPPKPEIQRTTWSHYLIGNVKVPQICYNSVESSCKNEASVCPLLHATRHFHWQVSDQGSRWLNLRSDQVTCLEHAYCDPATSTADLPRLDPSILDPSVSGLFILMGRDNWQAEFTTMEIVNSTKTKKLKIRRLCTEEINGQKMKPAIYVWYFLDKNNQWVLYGNVDTSGASHLVSEITSEDIEKSFLKDPSSPLSFKNSKFTYVLDFKTMTQMNLITRVSRKVIRRPYPHIQEKEKEEEKKKASADLPQTWKKMLPEERFCLVSLPPSSTEYKVVTTLLKGRISTSKILKIQRIQNPFLWRAFQNKIKEMMSVYKDESKVDIRQLFHGTAPEIISNICAENFDWRLHGTKSGQSFGRGSYFAVNADYSYGYTNPDSNNLRYMFVARVAVGAKIRGNNQMVRPPLNPASGILYDSSVDSVSNTTIVVKYDKQEYYPEYILTMD